MATRRSPLARHATLRRLEHSLAAVTTRSSEPLPPDNSPAARQVLFLLRLAERAESSNHRRRPAQHGAKNR